MESKEIKALNGEILSVGKILADKILALDKSKFLLKILIFKVTKKILGDISAEEISNKDLVNKGIIISNILKNESIKNDNKIIVNNSINTNKILNYSNGNISSENRY